jgi:uncharacterized protein with gpF-like domain
MAKTLSGLTPQQEQLAQERLRLTAEQAMRPLIAREIRRAMIAFGAAEGNADKQRKVMQGHRAEIERILAASYETVFDRVGKRIGRLGPKAHPHLFERKFAEAFEAAARAWITTMVANKVTPIINTTQRQAVAIIRAATLQGFNDGLGQREVARLIMDQITARGGEISRWRANVISRTETHTAAQAAGHEAAGSLGIAIRKEWVAAEDERTRTAHAEANGQIVDQNAPFVVGGEELMYPGDTSGSAENVINCRCASVAIILD